MLKERFSPPAKQLLCAHQERYERKRPIFRHHDAMRSAAERARSKLRKNGRALNDPSIVKMIKDCVTPSFMIFMIDGSFGNGSDYMLSTDVLPSRLRRTITWDLTAQRMEVPQPDQSNLIL